MIGWVLLGLIIGFVGGWFIAYVMYNPKFNK